MSKSMALGPLEMRGPNPDAVPLPLVNAAEKIIAARMAYYVFEAELGAALRTKDSALLPASLQIEITALREAAEALERRIVRAGQNAGEAG